MRGFKGKLLAACTVAASISASQLPTLIARTNSRSSPLPENVVACRVLEAHTSQQLRLTLVVFHHRDEKERGRLGTLLRERSGATVEFQAADGAWHSATVLRLKSCFGRGLLLFPVGTAQLADRDELVLKFPAD